jgi:uncharacterized protein YbjT (DUF2867 family)
MYVVTGATGNTGHRIAEALLAAGLKVRAVSRSEANLPPLVELGAEPFVGSLDDSRATKQAFQGARAVYAMIPPNYAAENFRAYQNQVAESLAQGIEQAGVPYVVSLSSLGADRADGVGPICGLHDLEQRLNTLPNANVLHLRPAFFMENFLFQVEIIKKTGAAGSPLQESVRMPMIALRDIAAVAVERLKKLDFSGKSHQELLGQRDLALPEAISILGKAIGRDNLAYVRFEYEDFARGMCNAGFSADAAASLIELYRALNEGRVQPTAPRSSGSTTPTSIEEFAQIFAAVSRQSELLSDSSPAS